MYVVGVVEEKGKWNKMRYNFKMKFIYIDVVYLYVTEQITIINVDKRNFTFSYNQLELTLNWII